jgi:acyl-CoA-binding protein
MAMESEMIDFFGDLMERDEFEYATERVWDLPKTPDSNELLELYKLYNNVE